MITRIWADLIDLWLLARRWGARLDPLRAPARNAWRALPGDLVGLAIMRLCGGLTPTREIPRVDGPPALLVEDPRTALYLDHVPLSPYAQTLGRYILAREKLPDATITGVVISGIASAIGWSPSRTALRVSIAICSFSSRMRRKACC